MTFTARKMLIIIPAADHFFTSWPQHNRVLPLRRITSLNIAQRGIRCHDPLIAQIFQCHHIFRFPDAVQPTPTKRQTAEILIDDLKKLLASSQTQRWTTIVLIASHIMRAFHIIMDVTFSSASKSFDSKNFVFLIKKT